MPCEIDEDLSSYASKYTFFSGLQSFNFSIAASIQTWGISILCFILKFECLNEFIEFFKVLSGYRSESKYNFSLLLLRLLATNLLFLLSGFFFHNHSRVTGLQGKGDGISLTPHYHFHPLHRHLDISWVITAESSPLHIGSCRTRTRNLWFPSASL